MPRVLEYSIIGTIPAGKGELVDLTDWVEKMVIDYSPNNHALLVVDKEIWFFYGPNNTTGRCCFIQF